MNIFYVSEDPKASAQMLNDKHVSKMCTETAQILSNIIPKSRLSQAPRNAEGGVRKYSYPKHPCCLWVKKSPRHAEWTFKHGIALANEKMYRYPNNKPHFCVEFLSWVGENLWSFNYDNFGWINPPQCMPDEYKNTDTVTAYRNYYNGEKLYFSKWTKRNIPYWVDKSLLV